MIVGCYQLHLYCRHVGEPECPYSKLNPTSYLRAALPALFGPGCETGAQARRAARRAGWVLDLRTMEATCPACAARKA